MQDKSHEFGIFFWEVVDADPREYSETSELKWFVDDGPAKGMIS
jgi:hypothetical protein